MLCSAYWRMEVHTHDSIVWGMVYKHQHMKQRQRHGVKPNNIKCTQASIDTEVLSCVNPACESSTSKPVDLSIVKNRTAWSVDDWTTRHGKSSASEKDKNCSSSSTCRTCWLMVLVLPILFPRKKEKTVRVIELVSPISWRGGTDVDEICCISMSREARSWSGRGHSYHAGGVCRASVEIV